MSRVWPYEIPDVYGLGSRLFVEPGNGAAEIRTEGSLPVAVDDLPQLVAALYAAAGEQEPVILEQKFRRSFDKCYFGPDFYIERRGADVIAGLGKAEVTLRGPRELAAYLVLVADEADAEAEAAEVEELGGIFANLRMRAVQPPSEELARAALRWMRDKRQQGESRDG